MSVEEDLPPPGWEPSEEDLKRLRDAPKIDLDADLGTAADEARGLERMRKDAMIPKEHLQRALPHIPEDVFEYLLSHISSEQTKSVMRQLRAAGMAAKMSVQQSIVLEVLTWVDPEGLIRMGAPHSEYSSEAKEIATAVLHRPSMNDPATVRWLDTTIRDIWRKSFFTGTDTHGSRHEWPMPSNPKLETAINLIRERLGIT